MMLVGKPLPEDQLLYAVPVCGPYMSIQQYKYRVKLTPGTLKRGKVFKQAMEVFAASKDMPPLEKMLLKGVQDTEAVAVLVSDARLSVPGLQQVRVVVFRVIVMGSSVTASLIFVQVKKQQPGQKKKQAKDRDA
jgi:hypothetical protein